MSVGVALIGSGEYPFSIYGSLSLLTRLRPLCQRAASGMQSTLNFF